MIDKNELIAFLYPSLAKGLSMTKVDHIPGIMFAIDDVESKKIVAITAGFIGDYEKIYLYEVGIYHDNESVLPDPDNPFYTKLITPNFYSRPNKSTLLSINTMYASDVDMSREGLYKVVLRVYTTKDGSQKDCMNDEKECFFYVRHRENSDEKR